ncbi:uncharacterized protein BXIN_1176 [Babesia sp. Xinjiang]|uniref:uncharacterized protein n=1 Tax=Babesia sp. Xinjiang TaxID=462227 RepID=UPI000A22D1C4|nr:uncharacterized protein BXIN_1176 [Babesia sp. Xinjiang]ORM40207.1 hypothetical protein BXIN_1176 [Babesia sp. Xinjiang]
MKPYNKTLEDMNSGRRGGSTRIGSGRLQEGKSRTSNALHDDSSASSSRQPSKITSRDPPRDSRTDRRHARDDRRDRATESPSSGRKSNSRSEPTLKKELEPAVTSTAENDYIIEGLALQRLWDDKPDVDSLANSLMQLYDNLEFKEGETDTQKDLLDRIVLTALRVKSKMEAHISRVSLRMKGALHHARHLAMKRACITKNIPNIKRDLVLMCQQRLWNKSVNDHYEKVYKVLNKIPSVPLLEERAKQLKDKQKNILETIESIKQQITSQKSQLEDICQLLVAATGSESPQRT